MALPPSLASTYLAWGLERQFFAFEELVLQLGARLNEEMYHAEAKSSRATD